MPGFLSEYDQTTTLKFGEHEEWWVKVRRFLTRAEFRLAQQVLVQPIMRSSGEDTETSGEVDTVGYQNELVIAAVVEWNLTDRDGVLLPLEPEAEKRRSIDLLPEEVFEDISKAIEGAAKKAEDAKKDATKDGKNGATGDAPEDPFRGRRARGAVPRQDPAG